ncbi:hypothetical protein TRAPUB_4791 [Trametes pubescens]|uniref:Uncharacterized protein n=1 Tax=Trametes pubescens TaxID=154538 RepID=A0A1M2VA61_TRAPU|nr:hypothetical protein TRAPUB_4791 [Trametes pubescens]
MSLLKAWKSVSSMNGPPDAPKKSRFSLMHRPSAPRRPPPGPTLDIELSDGRGVFWTPPGSVRGLGSMGALGALGEGGPGEEEVSLERSFTLSILEGQKHPAAHSRDLRESTGTTNTFVSCTETAPAPPSKALPAPPPPPVPPRSPSRARSTSVGSSRSVSAEGRRRKPSLRPQALGLPELEESRLDESPPGREQEHDHGLPPTYSSMTYPAHEVTYRFAQAGPFGMTLETEGKRLADSLGLWRYHIGVGMNVWTLRSWVTTVRRGGEDGLVVAEIE